MTQWGLDTIFNPAKRHMDEEKRRLQSTREEVGDNSGGKRIDLESGKVRIPAGADAEQTDDADSADPAESASAAAGKQNRRAGRTVRAGAAGEPTAAQQRAAARRGRTLG